MIKFKKLILMISALFLLSGCVAALIGVGAGVGIASYKYIEGNLIRDYPLAYHQAWDATNRALENRLISITNSQDEGDKGTIEAVRKDGKKVTIKLTDKGQGVTSISVRVGTFGDRVDDLQVHEEIASVAGI
jgi:hypothetical protein